MTLLQKQAFYAVIFVFLFSIKPAFPQIIFKELTGYTITEDNLDFIEKSSTRSTIILNGKWKVYKSTDESKKKTMVQIPSVHHSDAELVFEKAFTLNKEQIKQNNFELNFLGLNYSADIFINNKLVYKHVGGDFPFKFLLPKDWLLSDRENVLSVTVNSKADSWNTIPVKQSFLYPESFGGIFRDVYLRLLPNSNIGNLKFSYNFQGNTGRAKLNIIARVVNNEYQKASDSLNQSDNFEIKYFLQAGLEKTAFSSSTTFLLKQGKEKIVNQFFEIPNPILWSPSSPFTYKLIIQMFKQGSLVDEIIKPVSFYNLNNNTDSLTLNGAKFQFNGVTYISSNYNFGGMFTREQMRRDIRLIKELGFNSVRFSKSFPHPYLLSLCEEYGLLAFIELPLQGIPATLMDNQVFLDRSKNYLNRMWEAYNNFSVIAAVGLGNSYIANSPYTIFYLNELAGEFKKNNSRLLFASFTNLNFETVPKIDFYSIELFNKPVSSINEYYLSAIERLGAGKVFISEASYLSNLNSNSGSTNQNTFDSQAKNIEELILYFEQNNSGGYFINTMFDYRSEYHSIISGYNKEQKISLGILGEDRNTDRISYKVIYSRLHNLEKVTIPLGVKKDDSPMIFIVFGLGLALFMGFLVNTGRKFREDASRALLRPYNFFADIRDLRVISGIHSTLLAVIIAASLSLITASVLYSLKSEIFFEKVLVALGSYKLLNLFSYFTWHPVQSLIALSIIFFIKIVLIALIIKIASFFVMNKVFFSNAYYTVVWAMLPVVLTIPLAIVLYRLINTDIGVIYYYVVLIILAIWVVYRLIKGIYVIYDVRPGNVYFYSALFIIVAAGIFILYFQLKNSSVDYLLQVFKEFNSRI